ncbi:MAG TPA: helix-turn-helix domain-containing protein [Mucilaginibacter sp.]|jgi:AraC-like DNA-binding protein
MVEIFENIRKIYKFRAPCSEFADHIEFFSESCFEATQQHIAGRNFSVKMFPSWTPTFYINLGDPYDISVSGKLYHIGADEDILILRNSVVERYNTPADNIFTVKFYPGSLETVFDIKQSALMDKVINLDKILPAQLIENIKQPISFDKRVELMQNFFLSKFKKKQDYYLKFVKDSIDTYSDTGLQFSNSELAEKMFITSKTINRYFNNLIGTSPKNYFSIMRAREALTQYVTRKDHFVPFDYGYYDMSHFYKGVIKFTGQKLNENI